MTIYNQIALRTQLNRYLKYKKRSLVLQIGYCHGLALLWLYKMSKGEEDLFYQTIKKIIDCKINKDFDAIENEIEKFLAQIEWLQNSSAYEYDVNQLDIDQTMELPRELSLSWLFNQQQLDDVLATFVQKDKMVCLSGMNHTIGVYRRGDQYYIFDSNYNEGSARATSDLSRLKSEIIYCLYNQPINSAYRYPIEINIAAKKASLPSIIKTKLLTKYLQDDSDYDEPGLKNVTNLYLACESGDIEAVTLLLAKGAAPNRQCLDGWSALLIAAERGYTKIVKLLIDAGANINFKSKHGNSALHLALMYHHQETANLLIASGADPLSKNLRGETALNLAIKNKKFAPVMNILLNLGEHHHLTNADLKLIVNHKQKILAASHAATDLCAADKEQIEQILNGLYVRGTLNFFAPQDAASTLKEFITKVRQMVANMKPSQR